jgi:hypothetical protein
MDFAVLQNCKAERKMRSRRATVCTTQALIGATTGARGGTLFSRWVSLLIGCFVCCLQGCSTHSGHLYIFFFNRRNRFYLAPTTKDPPDTQAQTYKSAIVLYWDSK